MPRMYRSLKAYSTIIQHLIEYIHIRIYTLLPYVFWQLRPSGVPCTNSTLQCTCNKICKLIKLSTSAQQLFPTLCGAVPLLNEISRTATAKWAESSIAKEQCSHESVSILHERVPRSARHPVLGWKLPLSVIAMIATVVYSVKNNLQRSTANSSIVVKLFLYTP